MPDKLPARIGSYPIRGVIGSGSMGVVYLGHDPVIDRPVAVKTIQRQLLEDPAGQGSAAATRFRVEARAAGRLNHRNIVAIHQFGEDDACAYIVMEYVRGHSLAQYLQARERLHRDDVLSLMFQLLDALHYAHEAGVVHRDIKPVNLMVDRNGRLKITDFGIARTESAQATRANTMIGSPGYMAPEQYTGAALDRRVDVFSAGVLLYEMLAGRKPFTGSDEAIMYQIVYGRHPSLALAAGDPSLAAFEPILDRALAKPPEQRFASALEFLDALKAVAGGAVAERLAEDRLLPYESTEAPLPASSGPATDGPHSEPVPSGWDETELLSLERELTRHVGPVAKILVRRAARGQVELSVVRQLVASSIVDSRVRQRFLDGGGDTAPGSLRHAGGPSSGFGDTRPTTPPPGEHQLGPDDLDKAAAVLTRVLGPIAKVLVKRCAQGGVTRAQFMARVLEQLVARVDAKVVEAELWRVLG